MSETDRVVEAMARAYDAEDASHLGEPSPWDIGRACAQAALTAALSTGEVVRVTPELRALMEVCDNWNTHRPGPDSEIERHMLRTAIAFASQARSAGPTCSGMNNHEPG